MNRGAVALPDAYRALGVRPDASAAQLKAAHRRLVRRHHPDLVPEAERPAATRRVQDVNVAYGLVRDPTARARYDAARAGGSAVLPADLMAEAGRWAGRWWGWSRGRLRRGAVDAVGRVLWLATCVGWGVVGLLVAVAGQRLLRLTGDVTPMVGLVAGALVGSSRGWRRRLRLARLPQEGGPGRFAVAFGGTAVALALAAERALG